jgi:hypothetical protein
MFLLIKNISFPKRKVCSFLKQNKTFLQSDVHHMSWKRFLPMFWWKYDSEIYLCMVNSKTWIYHKLTLHLVHWNLVFVHLCCALLCTYDITSVIFQVANALCIRLQGMLCYLAGLWVWSSPWVDWRWGFHVLISFQRTLN